MRCGLFVVSRGYGAMWRRGDRPSTETGRFRCSNQADLSSRGQIVHFCVRNLEKHRTEIKHSMAASSTGSGLQLPSDEARQQASEARHGGDGGDGVIVCFTWFVECRCCTSPCAFRSASSFLMATSGFQRWVLCSCCNACMAKLAPNTVSTRSRCCVHEVCHSKRMGDPPECHGECLLVASNFREPNCQRCRRLLSVKRRSSTP